MVLSFSVSFGLCDKPCPWKKVRSDYAQFYLQVFGIEEWVALFYFCCELPIKSCSLKAAQEGRIFDINYPVFLLILREENLYPLSFSEQVINYALLSSIYVMNCETQNCGQKIN